MSEKSLFRAVSEINGSVPTDYGGGSPLSKCCLMAYLARLLDLKCFVEIGVYRGKSLLSVAVPFIRAGGSAIGIDPYLQEAAFEYDLDDEKKETVNSFIAKTDFNSLYAEVMDRKSGFDDSVQIIRDLSSNAVSTLRERGQRIDMLHIDGNHDTKFVEEDYANYYSLLADNAIIVFDDTDWQSVDVVYQKVKSENTVIFESSNYGILMKGKNEKTAQSAISVLNEISDIFTHFEGRLEASQGHAATLLGELEASRSHADVLLAELEASRGHADVLLAELEASRSHASVILAESEASRSHAEVLLAELETSRSHVNVLLAESEASRIHAAALLEELQASQGHAAVLSEELESSRRHSVIILEELEISRSNSATVSEQFEASRNHAAILLGELEASCGHSSVLLEELEVSRGNSAILSEELGASRNHAATLLNELEASRNELHAMRQSASWKITNPLRALKRVFARHSEPS
ncbi:MAG: class I SAM-dependent methyltransferase [Defluviitaleaceae bacterium]|nr:class I SAM-dependent methyltransferase [Defluviitaleaceae bacterium]